MLEIDPYEAQEPEEADPVPGSRPAAERALLESFETLRHEGRAPEVIAQAAAREADDEEAGEDEDAPAAPRRRRPVADLANQAAIAFGELLVEREKADAFRDALERYDGAADFYEVRAILDAAAQQLGADDPAFAQLYQLVQDEEPTIAAAWRNTKLQEAEARRGQEQQAAAFMSVLAEQAARMQAEQELARAEELLGGFEDTYPDFARYKPRVGELLREALASGPTPTSAKDIVGLVSAAYSAARELGRADASAHMANAYAEDAWRSRGGWDGPGGGNPPRIQPRIDEARIGQLPPPRRTREEASRLLADLYAEPDEHPEFEPDGRERGAGERGAARIDWQARAEEQARRAKNLGRLPS